MNISPVYVEDYILFSSEKSIVLAFECDLQGSHSDWTVENYAWVDFTALV